MKRKNYLAVDLGASNGRVICGGFDGKKLELTELNRFTNEYVRLEGEYYWNVLSLYTNIVNGINAFTSGNTGEYSGIGIDTWGVDFALIDREGRLVGNPRSYRDPRGRRGRKAFAKKYGESAAFDLTGISNEDFNTLFQLYDMAQSGDPALEYADKLLLLPDYLGYMLCGVKSSEFTEATTTQMVAKNTARWSDEVINMAGVNRGLFTDIQMPGTIKGDMTKYACELTGTKNVPKIICVGSHDTSSAIAAVPSKAKNYACISSGTWSLVALVLENGVVNEDVFKAGLSNEGIVGGKYSMLKNAMGMWLIQNCKKEWESKGQTLSWDDIVNAAENSEKFRSVIDVNDEIFYGGENPLQKIVYYCEKTEQPIPATVGEFARTIYESMAICYKLTLESLAKVTNSGIESVYIVGGGCRNKLLNKFTANATGKHVLAGPVEATAIGNILMQLKATGEINGEEQMREVIANSFELGEFTPENTEEWDEHTERFRKVVETFAKNIAE